MPSRSASRASVRWTSSAVAFLALASGFIAGCSDRAEPPSLVAPTGPAAAEVQAPGEPAGEFPIQHRFDLDLTAAGSLKPGRPVVLSVAGRARFATRAARVRVFLPEVAAGEDGGWEVVELPTGAVRPHLDTRLALSRGETFRDQVAVTIPEAGYYYVRASVDQLSDDRAADGLQMIGDTEARSFWMWIDERGGRITEDFDPGVFPPGYRVQRGPLSPGKSRSRVHQRGTYPECSVIVDGPVLASGCPEPYVYPDPPTPPPAQALLVVSYDDESSGEVMRALPKVKVQWALTNPNSTVVLGSGSAFTDANGAIPPIDCQAPAGQRNLTISVLTANERVNVKGTDGSTTAARLMTTCGGSTPVTVSSGKMAHLFRNLNLTAEGHDRYFPSQYDVMYAALYADGKTFYDYTHPDGELHIYGDALHVFGSYGAFVAAHEYGHKYQDRFWYSSPASSGLMRYYRNVCPEVHPPAEGTNLPCAIGEGVADWYAVLVRGDATGQWRSDLESNRYYLACTSGCTSDGSIVEGAVHSFLWDLTDASGTEWYDQIQVQPWQLAKTLQYCTVTMANGSLIAYTGIDHLIFCMEQRSPYSFVVNGRSTASTFFPTRTVWPHSARFVDISGNTDAFRKLWLIDLYSLRTDVGTSPHFDFAVENPPEVSPGDTTTTSCGAMLVC
jgi:hypothetical protein